MEWVDSVECNREILAVQIGLFHFENCLNLPDTNPEEVIKNHYLSIIKEIEFDKLKTLSKDFRSRSSDIGGTFYLFQDALRYASSHGEAYFDIKSVLFKTVNCIEKIVFRFSDIAISMEDALISFISFYKCLTQDESDDYENEAYAFLESSNGFQDMFLPVGQISLQLQSTIETEFIEKYLGHHQEQFEPRHISKLKGPTLLLQSSLNYLHCTEKTVISSYKTIIDARCNAHTVNSHAAKESFLDYYSYLVALCLTCNNIKNVLEDLLINFRSIIHES